MEFLLAIGIISENFNHLDLVLCGGVFTADPQPNFRNIQFDL